MGFFTFFPSYGSHPLRHEKPGRAPGRFCRASRTRADPTKPVAAELEASPGLGPGKLPWDGSEKSTEEIHGNSMGIQDFIWEIGILYEIQWVSLMGFNGLFSWESMGVHMEFHR